MLKNASGLRRRVSWRLAILVALISWATVVRQVDGWKQDGASPPVAHLTLKSTASLTTGPIRQQVVSVLYLKGSKARVDVKSIKLDGDRPGWRQRDDVSTIADVATGQNVFLNNISRRVLDRAAAIAGLPSFAFGDPKVSAQPSDRTRQILGRRCTAFDVNVVAPVTIGGETVMFTISGPAWITEQGDGIAQYRRLVEAAAATGVTVSPFSLGPASRGYEEMVKTLSRHGLVVEQEMQVVVEGSGQVVRALGPLNMTAVFKLTEIAVGPLADHLFVVPNDYKK